MLKSMTGFGQATVGRGKDKWTVEIRSLNHRFLEYSARLPQVLAPLENDIKNLIQAKVRRGKISLSISFNGGESVRENVAIDEQKLDFYYRSLRRIAHRLKIDPKLTLHDLVGLPNIFLVEKGEFRAAKEWQRLQNVIRLALDRLQKMKVKEGQALKKQFLLRLELIEEALKRIEKSSQQAVLQYQERLKARVSELTKGIELDHEKLAREVAIMAERSDITEEIVRLGNHLKLFQSTLDENGEIGKKLDFITQEMNREANTIASKSPAFQISQDAVNIKSEIEKIREQVQNIE